MSQIPEDKLLILFDGVCNLCNSSVTYIIRHDAANRFVFAALQSEFGQELVSRLGVDTAKTDSIVLVKPEGPFFVRSTAALKIASRLGFPRNLLTIFWIIPPFIRDAVYKYIAKNRYKWYGKRDQCMVPTKALLDRFLT